MNELRAIQLLNQLRGDEIWSPETCRAAGIPEAWIEELNDCFESGFLQDSQTIYVGVQVRNQFEGCRDLDLAWKLAEYLGIETSDLRTAPKSPRQLVRELQERWEEG